MYYTFIFSEVKYNYPDFGINGSFIETDKYITTSGEKMAEQSNEEKQKKVRNVDYRARLQLFRGVDTKEFFGESELNVMAPLKANRGIVFPYTPSIYIQRAANYGSMDFKGSNYPLYSFANSNPPMIPLIATFTASSKEEARYMLAVLRFLNVMAQADFGEQAVENGKFGAPPALLQFSYLGPFGFDRVPCILVDWNVMFSNTVDYVPVEHDTLGESEATNTFSSAFGDKNVTYVPTDVEFTINLQPQYSPRRIRKDFNLDDMKKGKNIGFL